MNNKTLSIMPYYGGKSRMAHFIADKLNYDDSDIYIEPFGGACRVLLNKPRHKIEIYNDYGEGVSAVMNMISDPKKAKDYIYTLYETEYSLEQFNWAKDIFDRAEIDLDKQIGNKLVRELRSLFIDLGIITPNSNMRVFNSIMKSKEKYNEILRLINQQTPTQKEQLFKKLKGLSYDYTLINTLKQEQGFLERARDIGEYISDMDLAIATYIVFTQSRDAMGLVWSGQKFKSTEHYRKQILNLFEVVERMEGVLTYQIDAMDFFRWYIGANREEAIQGIDDRYAVMLRWIHDPKVMMYCDPSYINPNEEEKLLRDIDWKNESSLSEAVRKKYNNKMPDNLGKIYSMSFEYQEHENFLQCIYDAECKLMVSNYDLILYNKYLKPENNWKKIEFETSTSVGGKSGNYRKEVLWYNY